MRFLAVALLILICLAAIVLGYIIVPHAAACGWLIGFVFMSGLLIGNLALSMIHRLTGGEWYAAVAYASAPMIKAVPGLLIAVVPVFASAVLLFHWNHVRPSVLHLWLNLPGYDIRTVTSLAILSGFSFWLPRRPTSLLWPALGLVVFGVTANIFALDWILALHPTTFFTAWGSLLGIEQLLTGLALAILLTPRIRANCQEELANLFIAMTMGALYMSFMQFLIIWYGDVPDRAAWYAVRTIGPWPALLIASGIFGAAVPMVLLLASRTRFLLVPLRTIAASLLLGGFCYDGWMIAPAAGLSALIFAPASAILIGAMIGALVKLYPQSGVA